jgi:hypothetical protein
MRRDALIVELEELIDWIGKDSPDPDVFCATVVLHALCGALLAEDTPGLAACVNAFSAGALERLSSGRTT